jgi:Copper binding proteins, plastocyanin/azurin family
MKATLVRIELIAAAAVACLALLPIVAASRAGDPEPRDVVIVARDMTFYVDGQETPNPTLRFRAGERIRLVLRNEDAGITHDFVINAWNVATRSLGDKGAQDSVVFRVPAERAPATYRCTPHSEMMRGGIQVD